MAAGEVADWLVAHVIELLRFLGAALVLGGLSGAWLVSRDVRKTPDEFRNKIVVQGTELLAGRPFMVPALTILAGLTLAIQSEFVTAFTVLGALTLVTGGDWVIRAIAAYKGETAASLTDATPAEKNEQLRREAEKERAAEAKPADKGLGAPHKPPSPPRPLSVVLQEAWRFEETVSKAILQTPEFKDAEFKAAFKLRTRQGEDLLLDGAFARPNCIYLLEVKHLLGERPVEPMVAELRHLLGVYRSWNEFALAPRPARAILAVSKRPVGPPPSGEVFMLVVDPPSGQIENVAEFQAWMKDEPSYEFSRGL